IRLGSEVVPDAVPRGSGIPALEVADLAVDGVEVVARLLHVLVAVKHDVVLLRVGLAGVGVCLISGSGSGVRASHSDSSPRRPPAGLGDAHAASVPDAGGAGIAHWEN